MTNPRSRRRCAGWVLAPLAILYAVASATVASADPVAGSQGTDTSLPATASAVTVNGRGQFAGMAFTVNQTQDLNNQAVSITWTGGAPTLQGPGRFGANFVQIMQCWGDDDGTVPGNPGPPPEQCEQGAASATYAGVAVGALPGGLATTRVIFRSSWPGYDATVGRVDTRTTNVWRPFRAVNGTEIGVHVDPTFNPALVGGNYWLNPYFNIVTTNEIGGAATGKDGRGAELFEVQTGVQASGLGCGQSVQPVAGGGTKIPRCWIVIVPRGSAADANTGTPFADNADQFGVYTSPLSTSAWQHRIAIPIEFNPVDSPCSLAADERRISGSELALAAVASWQPVLCGSGPPYSFAPTGDATARQQLTSGATGAPGMVVVSKPLSSAPDPQHPVVYAPVTLSGLTIGFNIERNPRPDAPGAEQQLAGVRVAQLNLTPRLVAKLLTQSYTEQVTILRAPAYDWLAGNPAHLAKDPDFLQFNPEFQLLQIGDGRTFSGLQLPSGTSDAAGQVWQWVLADPEARAWLDGQPDQWGMRVNPVYATTAEANSNHIAFGDPLPNSFPKGDPYCYQAAPRGVSNSIVPPSLCGTDWMPYARNFADAARIGRIAFDAAKIIENPNALSAAEVWTKDVPQYLGTRSMLTLTDTPSATQFGLQMAHLSRAGDDGSGRTFVAPDAAGLTAGAVSMAAGSMASVREPAPLSAPPDAYPLTSLTYAAIAPLGLDAQARTEYAAFLDYAAGPGQVIGLELGQLPLGYAPLPADLQVQALAAAEQVRTMTAPVAVTTTTTVPVATSPPQVPPATVRSTPRTNSSRTTPTVPVTVPVESSTTEVTTTTEGATTTTEVLDEADEPPTKAPLVLTPFVELARSRFAVPGIGVMALGSALGVLEITKRPRRRVPSAAGTNPLTDAGDV